MMSDPLNPYASPRRNEPLLPPLVAERMEPPHSGLGIASFVISILSGVLIFFLIVIAGVMEASTPGGMDEESVGAIVVGLFLIGFLFTALVALGLGIGGLVQRNRKKIFAILGTVFSGLTIVGTLFIMLLGLAMG